MQNGKPIQPFLRHPLYSSLSSDEIARMLYMRPGTLMAVRGKLYLVLCVPLAFDPKLAIARRLLQHYGHIPTCLPACLPNLPIRT